MTIINRSLDTNIAGLFLIRQVCDVISITICKNRILRLRVKRTYFLNRTPWRRRIGRPIYGHQYVRFKENIKLLSVVKIFAMQNAIVILSSFK